MAKVKLVVIDGPDVGSEFELELDSTALGRDPEAGIALGDPAVSREHVRVERDADGWCIVDLGSRNRSFLNGRAVSTSALTHGDVIRVGDTQMRFEDSDSVGPAPGGSTIFRATPAADAGASFIRRIDRLEEMLREQKAKRALEEVRRLVEAQGRLSQTGSAAELFRRILDEVAPALEADSAAVLMRDGESWAVRASRPEDGFDRGAVSISVVDRAADSGEALLVADPSSDEHLRERRSIVEESIDTALAIPLRSAGEVRAVVYADRRGGGTNFGDDDLRLLSESLESAGPLLARLLEEERLREENDNLFRSITDSKQLIGRSEAIERTLRFIERAAPTPATVLIQGETGTGKELVASAIHYASRRRGRPFVAINCAALPESLAESELFGHEKGAFTSASARRKGRFELAHSGTVFLDEVGELSPAVQAKLLRLLEERVLERVGGSDPISVDVRVVAATNRDLLAAVERGEFREDLFYRLNVLNVTLPPLRERTEDIPLLVEHFLEDRCGTSKKLTKAAEKKLLSHTWPGNIRQLRNVIESAVVLGESKDIRPEDIVLPPAGRGGGQGQRGWEPIRLAELERQHVLRVLEHTGGNKKRAAELLGIERCTLYSKLKTYAADSGDD